MKKLLLILMLVPLFGISQARLGSTRNEIYSEFAELIPSFSQNADGVEYLIINIGNLMVLHYFNDNNICKTSVIYPETQGSLNALVESYNKQYVILGPKTWRMYTNNGEYADVNLVTANGVTFFVWQ